MNVTASSTYTFRTTFPGKYGDPGCLRPAHVHMRVTARGYKALVTQLYFRGDTNLGDNDCGCGSFCNSGNPALQVALRGGAGAFNIVLARA
jgi:protocatechuate 3,4-dioxygenase beta subunit